MTFALQHYKKALGIIWFGLLCALGVFIYSYVSMYDMSFKDFLLMVREDIKGLLMAHMVLAPLVYIIIYIVRPLVFLPTSILTPLSSAVFGPLLGWIYTFIGENIAASVAFLVARYFGGDQVKKFKKLALIETELKEHGLRTVIFLRLVPLFPFDVVNFGLGFTSIKWREYVIGTALGVIPGLTAYIFLGASLFSGMYIIPTITLFIVLSLLAHYLRKKNNRVTATLSK